MYIFLIHSSVGGHMGCFHPLVNNTAMHIGVQYLVEFLVSIFPGIYLGVKLSDHMVILFELNFGGGE